MSVTRAQQHAIDSRRRQVAALYLQGLTQAEIADRVGVCQKTVSNDLAAVRAQWQAARTADFDSVVCEQLARIDAAEAFAWQQLHNPPVVTRAEQSERVGDNGTVTTDKTATEQQAPNPAWLDRVQWCIRQRCELLGLAGVAAAWRSAGQALLDELLGDEMARSRIAEAAAHDAPLSDRVEGMLRGIEADNEATETGGVRQLGIAGR